MDLTQAIPPKHPGYIAMFDLYEHILLQFKAAHERGTLDLHGIRINFFPLGYQEEEAPTHIEISVEELEGMLNGTHKVVKVVEDLVA